MGETFMAAVSVIPAAPGTSTLSVIVHRLLTGVREEGSTQEGGSSTGIILQPLANSSTAAVGRQAVSSGRVQSMYALSRPHTQRHHAAHH